MDFYTILVKAHGGFAMLMFTLALLSFLFAIKTLVLESGAGFFKGAKILAGIEAASAGLVTLTGIVLLLITPLPLSFAWMWLGLVIAVLYAIVQKRWVKPARESLEESSPVKGAAASKWAIKQAMLLVMVFVAMGLMQAKPF